MRYHRANSLVAPADSITINQAVDDETIYPIISQVFSLTREQMFDVHCYHFKGHVLGASDFAVLPLTSLVTRRESGA